MRDEKEDQQALSFRSDLRPTHPTIRRNFDPRNYHPSAAAHGRICPPSSRTAGSIFDAIYLPTLHQVNGLPSVDGVMSLLGPYVLPDPEGQDVVSCARRPTSVGAISYCYLAMWCEASPSGLRGKISNVDL